MADKKMSQAAGGDESRAVGGRFFPEGRFREAWGFGRLTAGAWGMMAVAAILCLAGGCGQDMTIAPEYSNPRGMADTVTAQSLVRLCGAAQQAGWDFVAQAGGDVAETVRLIVEGHRIDRPGSPFHGAYFGLEGLGAEEQARAAEKLTIINGKLLLGTR